MEYEQAIPLLQFSGEYPDEETIANSIEIIKADYPEKVEVAVAIAKLMAGSGQKITPDSAFTADVASTGGPSSLSTLIAPLVLRAAGAIVPKLGVSGRPAGGIDCLAQIPGYKTTLTAKEVMAILGSGGYAHFLARGELAPLDGRVFDLRRQMGALNVPTLVVASLLAKKLAVGVRFAGLDVRVAPHGNFGTDWAAATKNARLFKAVAKILGVHATVVLTDGRYPYQPYIGRGEALLALHDLFCEKASDWLLDHYFACRTMAMACVPEKHRANIAELGASELEEFFYRNLDDQGTSQGNFISLVEKIRKEHEFQLTAKEDGFCSYRLDELRRLFVQWQTSASGPATEFPDPIGIILLKRQGAWVKKGTSIATVRIKLEQKSDILSDLHSVIYTTSFLSAGSGIEVIDE